MSATEKPRDGEEVEAIRRTRIETLVGVWETFIGQGRFDGNRLRLSPPLANEVVEHYLADRRAMKDRYKISGRIQLYKVAGIMASCILRYRPIVPIADDLRPGKEFFANELFAIYHGIAVCAEFAENPRLPMLDELWFKTWRDNMVWFMHYRNHTTESLCAVFMTLTMLKLPECLEKSHD